MSLALSVTCMHDVLWVSYCRIIKIIHHLVTLVKISKLIPTVQKTSIVFSATNVWNKEIHQSASTVQQENLTEEKVDKSSVLTN